MYNLEKLITLASDAFVSNIDLEKAKKVIADNQLIEILRKKNGFFAFESALHIFPLSTVEVSYGLDDWNSHELWRKDYGNLTKDLFFFAEDVFGGQYCLKDREVCSFDPETGDCTPVAKSIDEWVAIILNDYKTLTGYPLAHLWQETHGLLSPRERLIPKKFFVMGGEYSIDNLLSIDGAKGMQIRGPIAQQIHDLSDGARVEFKITDWQPIKE